MAKSKVNTKKPKSLKKKGLRIRRKTKPESIVIDQDAGMVFSSETELLKFFKPQIEFLEKEYYKIHPNGDDAENKIDDIEDELELTLDEPTEIWHDRHTFKEFPIFYFFRDIEGSDSVHIGLCYVNRADEPTFVFLHFITANEKTMDYYRRGELVYDRSFEEVEFGAIEGDALTEGDPLAIGLFISMLKVRSEKDLSQDKFKDIGYELREATIEEADEIWRNTDLNGNLLVTFIRSFPEHETSDMHYIAVTQEDPNSHVHSLLFSFPTSDPTLVDRYRRGENLQAEEVVQESSH